MGIHNFLNEANSAGLRIKLEKTADNAQNVPIKARFLRVGIGVIAFYLTVLVTVTFYLRKKIGMTAFRTIHYTSLLAYFGSTLHGLFAGTDSSLPMALLMYLGSFLVIFFLTVYWLVSIWLRKASDSGV